jgi:anti-sigma B factor antagonist
VVSLEAAIRQSGDVTILDLAGRVITGQGQEVLAAELRRLVDGGTRKLLVNLERVAQLDSSGISSLVRAFVTLGRSGGSLKLLRPQGRVRDVLEMTRLLTAMAAFDDEAAALASFR